MESGDEPYTIGIDGLPLGEGVAIALDGRLIDTFTVEPVDLPARVAAAVAAATTRMGGPPCMVRLVVVDDGGDGSVVGDLRTWLSGQGIKFEALDLVVADGIEPIEPGDPESHTSRSLLRAIDAARSDVGC